jgi:hypothetical protein
MTLYEYLKMTERDFDTYDTKYDVGVTVCHIYEEDECDEYDKFCNSIMKKVNVVKINADVLIVDWCELIERNLDRFKNFTEEYWKYKYDDDIDEFMCQWINEIHLYMAGYVDEYLYSVINNFIDTLE